MTNYQKKKSNKREKQTMKPYIISWYMDNDNELPQAQKQQIVDYLIADRMSNYGYDWKTFKKMSAQRSRLRAMLRLADINKENHQSPFGLNWKNLDLGRFHFKNGEVTYIVGQSSNEEITCRMQELVSKNKNYGRNT